MLSKEAIELAKEYPYTAEQIQVLLDDNYGDLQFTIKFSLVHEELTKRNLRLVFENL